VHVELAGQRAALVVQDGLAESFADGAVGVDTQAGQQRLPSLVRLPGDRGQDLADPVQCGTAQVWVRPVDNELIRTDVTTAARQR